MLCKENWNDIINEINVDEKSCKFINTITHYFNIAFPIKKILPTHNKEKNWVTKGTITSCRRKTQLHHLCQITNDPNLKLYYKKYTKILGKVIYEAKSKSNRDFIMKAENKGKVL